MVPGLRLSSKSTSQLGGNPGRSSGKTSGHSFTMGTNDESSFLSEVMVTSTMLYRCPFWSFRALLDDISL